MEEKIKTESVDKQHEYEHEHEHTHQLADGTIIRHSHGHHHSHTQTKAVLNRMARLIGHLEAIKRMVEEGRDCSEVLVQRSAVPSMASARLSLRITWSIAWSMQYGIMIKKLLNS